MKTLEDVRTAAAEAAKKAIEDVQRDTHEKVLHQDKIEEIYDGHFEKALDGAPHRQKDGWKVAGKWATAIFENDIATIKDLSVGTGANGGYLAPIEFSGMLIEKLYKLPVIRPYATKIPMTSDQMQVPLEESTPAVNWTPELAAATQSDPTFGQITLLVNELIGISRMSRQLLADAAIQYNITDWVISRFAAAIGRGEDTAFMVGSGSGQPKGFRQYSISNAVAQAGSHLVGNDIINLVYSVPFQYREGQGPTPVFLVPDTAVKYIRELQDTSGRYIWSDNFESGGLTQPYRRATILGFPVLVQNDIPTNLGGGSNATEIWFGRADYYVIGDRDQIFSEISTQEGTSFAQHRAAVKVGERIDGQLTFADGVSKLTGVIQ